MPVKSRLFEFMEPAAIGIKRQNQAATGGENPGIFYQEDKG
jgi:hypothetical protein